MTSSCVGCTTALPVGAKPVQGEGYFQDNSFFEGGAFHVGDVAADGAFLYRVNLPDGSPKKFPNHVAGHVVGLTLTLTLTRVDGTVFELVEQPE